MTQKMTRRTFMGGTATGVMAMAATSGTAHAADTKWKPRKLSKTLTLDELNTPALLIDLPLMESNLRKMAEHSRRTGVGIRPHTKTHKCPIIAKKQIELGAVGVCAAKVGEAEVMIDAGIENVLITSPVVTKEKIDRVIALAKRSAGFQMMVDNSQTVDDFNEAAAAAGVTLRVLVGLDTGTRRTGIPLGKPAVKLVKRVVKSTNLQFDGIQAYAGHLMHIKGHEKRKARSEETMARSLDTKAMIEKAGYEVGVFSGGGTGTFDIDSGIEGFTDLQTGSYLFMDVQYRAIGDTDSKVFDYFDPSLFVLVTAISQPVPTMITVDSGYKAFASDSVRPEFRIDRGLVYNWGGDEHGMCQIKDGAQGVKLGDKMEMIVSHCDPTVNLYDFYHPYRDGKVEELWPIAARGRSQ